MVKMEVITWNVLGETQPATSSMSIITKKKKNPEACNTALVKVQAQPKRCAAQTLLQGHPPIRCCDPPGSVLLISSSFDSETKRLEKSRRTKLDVVESRLDVQESERAGDVVKSTWRSVARVTVYELALSWITRPNLRHHCERTEMKALIGKILSWSCLNDIFHVTIWGAPVRCVLRTSRLQVTHHLVGSREKRHLILRAVHGENLQSGKTQQ